MQPLRVALLLAGLMVTASLAGFALDPTRLRAAAPAQPRYVLDAVVPKRFGSWQEAQQGGALVVNPQAQELLDKIYSQMLNRTYVDASGYQVMLSLAYGDDQRGGLAAHMPEVCYPAQGFTVAAQHAQAIVTPYGSIAAQRLDTRRGPRLEPVTYWFNFGEVVLSSGSRLERRLIELQLALTGRVPDGLLVRVSSIDGDLAAAFAAHDRFVADLVAALSAADRARFTGTVEAAAPPR